MELRTLVWTTTAALIMTAAFTRVVLSAPLPELDCVIEPHMLTDISSQVDGIVESIEVERGDLIEKNQVLARLDASVEKATVDYARMRAAAIAEVRANKTSAEFSGRRQERVETLYQSKALSLDQMDETGTQARLAELQLALAREDRELARLDLVRAVENLKRHTILSPIDGVVVERFLSLGESVEEKPILRLAQIDPLRVEVIVPILHIRDISVDQHAMVFPEEPIKGAHRATVTIVDRVADAASGTFRVRLTLPNPDFAVPAGLRCSIQFSEREPETTTIARRSAPPIALADDVRIVSNILGGKASGATAAKQPRPEVVDVATSVAINKNKNGQNVCATLGPIDTAERAEALRVQVAPKVREARLRQVRREDTQDYMILTPAAANLAEALALLEAIRQAGIEDVSVVRRGKNALRVSIGYYKSKKGADGRRDRGAALGFETEVVPRMMQTESFWLDIGGGPDNALAALLADIAPDVASTVEQCDRFVVADDP